MRTSAADSLTQSRRNDSIVSLALNGKVERPVTCLELFWKFSKPFQNIYAKGDSFTVCAATG